MDTKIFYVAIISIAIGGLMWQLAGFGALFAGQSPGENLESANNVSDQADDAAIDGNFSGNAQPSDGDLVGLILSGGSRIFSILGMVVFLPGELMELGLPSWAAQPLGYLATIFISIGAIQFVAGRILR